MESDQHDDAAPSQLGLAAPYNLATVSDDGETATRVVHALVQAGIPEDRLTWVASSTVAVPEPLASHPAEYVRVGQRHELMLFTGFAHQVPTRDLFRLLAGVDGVADLDLVTALEHGAVIVVAHCEDGIAARE